MSTILTSIAPIWKVLIVGLILGAGLPALFALGVRASAGTTAGDGVSVNATTPAGRVVAALCFLVVGLIVVAAIIVLAASKAFLAKFGLS
jgi:hypothetical protein